MGWMLAELGIVWLGVSGLGLVGVWFVWRENARDRAAWDAIERGDAWPEPAAPDVPEDRP